MWLYTHENRKRVRQFFIIVGIIMIISFLALYIPSLRPPAEVQNEVTFMPQAQTQNQQTTDVQQPPVGVTGAQVNGETSI